MDCCHSCSTLPLDRSAEALSRLQDACTAAGVRVSAVRPEALATLLPPLHLPATHLALLAANGGVLDQHKADQLLLQLACMAGTQCLEHMALSGEGHGTP